MIIRVFTNARAEKFSIIVESNFQISRKNNNETSFKYGRQNADVIDVKIPYSTFMDIIKERAGANYLEVVETS